MWNDLNFPPLRHVYIIFTLGFSKIPEVRPVKNKISVFYKKRDRLGFYVGSLLSLITNKWTLYCIK